MPGASGSRRMPRKMAGIAMITMDASMVAIVMLSVVLDSAIHLYRPPSAPAGECPFSVAPAPRARLRSASLDTLIHATPDQLLDRNYLLGRPAVGHAAPRARSPAWACGVGSRVRVCRPAGVDRPYRADPAAAPGSRPAPGPARTPGPRGAARRTRGRPAGTAARAAPSGDRPGAAGLAAVTSRANTSIWAPSGWPWSSGTVNVCSVTMVPACRYTGRPASGHPLSSPTRRRCAGRTGTR